MAASCRAGFWLGALALVAACATPAAPPTRAASEGAQPSERSPARRSDRRPAAADDSALSSAPAIAAYVIAQTRLAGQDGPGAERALAAAVQAAPTSALLRAQHATALLLIGRLDQARKEAQQGISLSPQLALPHLALARVELAENQGGPAAQELAAALARDPTLGEAHLALVQLRLAQGDTAAAQQAAQALERAAAQAQSSARQTLREESDPGDREALATRLRGQAAQAWVELSRAQAQPGRWVLARAAADRALSLEPRNPDVLLTAAHVREQMEDLAGARELILRQVARDPEAPEPYAELSRLSLEEPDPRAAAAYADKVLALAREAAQASLDERKAVVPVLGRLAQSWTDARRSAVALTLIGAAEQLLPGDAELGLLRGTALLQLGRDGEAAHALGQAEKRLRLAPPEARSPVFGAEPAELAAQAQAQRILAQARGGAAARACDEALAALQPSPRATAGANRKAPEGEDPRGPLAAAAVEVCERADKLSLLEAALSSSTQPELQLARANALDRAGQRAQALAALRALLDQQPDNASALNFLGYALAEQGGAALAEAERLLRRARELRPGEPAVLDSLGYCLLRQGRLPEARPLLERASLLLPGDPVALLHTGEARLAAGDRPAAIAALQAALSRSPPAGIDPFDRDRDPDVSQARAAARERLRSLAVSLPAAPDRAP